MIRCSLSSTLSSIENMLQDVDRKAQNRTCKQPLTPGYFICQGERFLPGKGYNYLNEIFLGQIKLVLLYFRAVYTVQFCASRLTLWSVCLTDESVEDKLQRIVSGCLAA